MDEKTRTFLAQLAFSMLFAAFCIAMIANDSEKNLPIFLPLLTAEIGRWAPGPKLKRDKSKDGGAQPQAAPVPQQVPIPQLLPPASPMTGAVTAVPIQTNV